MTLNEIVEDYIRKYRERAQRELRSFQILRSLEQAIDRAAQALTPSGRKFDHQKRIKQASIARSLDALLAVKDGIQSCRTFDELFVFVRSTVGTIEGIGELYVYDTSLRIGAKLSLFPTCVYLHAGTREGAAALGLNVHRDTIPVDEFPLELQRLQPQEIEDVLCIYKDEL
jgi:hypothetical protein